MIKYQTTTPELRLHVTGGPFLSQPPGDFSAEVAELIPAKSEILPATRSIHQLLRTPRWICRYEDDLVTSPEEKSKFFFFFAASAGGSRRFFLQNDGYPPPPNLVYNSVNNVLIPGIAYEIAVKRYNTCRSLNTKLALPRARRKSNYIHEKARTRARRCVTRKSRFEMRRRRNAARKSRRLS